ncbi:MAG: phosphate signaling complex protein PhoU [Anaerolineales bacterium]|nr:phosphate signaling complex protein PhoU [Anaerolineales bacterium]
MSHSLWTTFDREFAQIQESLLQMGLMVDQAIALSLESLQNRDHALAKQVIDDDEEINAIRFKIEDACLALIATQQPAASDLRSVVAVITIVINMERMADHAAGIAKTVILMGDEPLLKPLIDIPRMVRLAQEMLGEVLQAFVDNDADTAQAIADRDDEMDHLYQAIFEELLEIMADKPDSIERATYLLWCAHNLERIGDRVTNIAERVIFVSTGDMRELNV